MNENQTKKGFWEIADKIEDAHIQLENINYLTQLLDEGLERDVSYLVTDGDERVKWFIARYNMHQAQLTAIEMLFKTVNQQLYELADTIRAQHEPEET